ncbi:MAG: hypothetical protein AAGI48_13135 [Verrucomicrobiota bacterium]
MKPHLSLTTLLFATLSTSAYAQSAANFQQPAEKADGTTAPDLAEEVQIEEIDKETQSALVASPSRYAGLDVDQYVQALSTSFSMRNRDIDPFARHQDPNFRPIQPVIAKKKIKKFKKEPVTPFSDIVARVNITAVMPAEQTFLVGGRSFNLGDRINLDVGKEKLLSIHVVGIQKNSVTFRHGVTGETADRILNIMPEGMRRGTNLLPPGLESLNNDAPIDARPTGQPITTSRR